MMYDITKIYISQLLHGLHLVFGVDVREGVQNVSEVLKIIHSICQKLGRNDVRHDKKYFHQLLDGNHQVLAVDVHEGIDDEKNSFAVSKLL